MDDRLVEQKEIHAVVINTQHAEASERPFGASRLLRLRVTAPDKEDREKPIHEKVMSKTVCRLRILTWVQVRRPGLRKAWQWWSTAPTSSESVRLIILNSRRRVAMRQQLHTQTQ